MLIVCEEPNRYSVMVLENKITVKDLRGRGSATRWPKHLTGEKKKIIRTNDIKTLRKITYKIKVYVKT